MGGSAAFSPDGKRVVTASDDNTARLWDADTGKEAAVLKGHTNRVWSAAFSPDGKRVVTASADNTARLWDADTGKEAADAKLCRNSAIRLLGVSARHARRPSSPRRPAAWPFALPMPERISPILPQSTGPSDETARRGPRLAGVTRWLVDAA
jgi:WD40 repeat protein